LNEKIRKKENDIQKLKIQINDIQKLKKESIIMLWLLVEPILNLIITLD